VQHETNHEYEKAKRCIFNSDKKTFDYKGYNSTEKSQFHPVFLSSLLNQQVFKKDVAMQTFLDEEEGQGKNEAGKVTKHKYIVDKQRKETNKRITENIQSWLNQIELEGHFGELDSDNKQMAWNLFELLEKTVANWEADQ
jgi:hypothetical protein